MANNDTPNRQSNMEKAEGDRASAEQYEKGGDTGITNRPLDTEIDNQERVPDRGERKPGTHAG
jgi:hypothetical protein